MRILLCLLLTFFLELSIAQLQVSVEMFEELAEVTLNPIQTYDAWQQQTTYYPSGRKQDEVRIYVSSECDLSGKCIIKYQHQVYYDNDQSTLTLKEGKYMQIKKGKVTYRHYGWWYTKEAKLYRRLREKTIKKL